MNQTLTRRTNDPTRLDGQESAFFARELEYIKVKTYDTKYKPLKAFTLLPIESDIPNGATEATFRSYTGVGLAKFISDYAHDLPRVDVYGSETTLKVREIGDSYGYSIKEIRSARMTGKRLDQRKADMARRAIDEKINKVAWLGDSDFGIYGLINYPSNTEYTVPADGTGSSKLWANKTALLILRDMNGLVNTPVNLTNGIEQPDVLLLPLAKFNLVATTPIGDNADKTILKFFLDNSPYIKRVEFLVELNGAGASGTDRMLCYVDNVNNLALQIPQLFEQFDEQWKGLEAEIPCQASTAGVFVYFPLAIAYGDGI